MTLLLTPVRDLTSAADAGLIHVESALGLLEPAGIHRGSQYERQDPYL
ncbi:hypothetical protein [Mycolicibacterium sp. 018/SC-01/001]|nr:hypothetical protein [Mycolicibacterium sp. 018/SC-01/001]